MSIYWNILHTTWSCMVHCGPTPISPLRAWMANYCGWDMEHMMSACRLASLLASVVRDIQNSIQVSAQWCLARSLAAAETKRSWEHDSDASKQLLWQFNGHISQWVATRPYTRLLIHIIIFIHSKIWDLPFTGCYSVRKKRNTELEL